MEIRKPAHPLESIFLGEIPRSFTEFERIVNKDGFNPQPTVVFIDGHEVRLSYTPGDFAPDGKREVKIIGIQDAPEATLRTLGTHFSKGGLTVKLARYDGRSELEDIDL